MNGLHILLDGFREREREKWTSLIPAGNSDLFTSCFFNSILFHLIAFVKYFELPMCLKLAFPERFIRSMLILHVDVEADCNI